TSAAFFTRFYRERINPSAEFVYQGLSHKGAGVLDEALFDGDENVIVDFRYSVSPKLTWWFDHHVSAFPNPGEESHFRADQSGHKFYDPAAKSCTRFLARVASEKFGFDAEPLKELLEWAEIIDGALFPDARTAVRLEHPALRLMMVIEANPTKDFIPKIIGELQRRSLAEIIALPWVAEPLKPLFEKHEQAIEVVRRKARFEDGVVFFDVADENLETLNKFIAYELYPEARYTVTVSRTPGRAKVGVGSNPWKRESRTHDLAKICERYGGGGHPVVGAVSYPTDQLEKARQTAGEILRELQQG
ncbi:MAG: hypothetical protein ACK4N5_24175, partial [Myxococcales bacterium]